MSAGHSQHTSSGPSRSASTDPIHTLGTRTHPANAGQPGSPGTTRRPGTTPATAGTSSDSQRHQQDVPAPFQPYPDATLLKQIPSTCVLIIGDSARVVKRAQLTMRPARRARLAAAGETVRGTDESLGHAGLPGAVPCLIDKNELTTGP